MVNIVAEPGTRIALETPPPPAGTEEIAFAALPRPSAAQPAPADAGAERMRMGDMLPMAAVALAIFAATLSAVGLAIASRTVAEARATMIELREAQHDLAALPAELRASTARHTAPAAPSGTSPAAMAPAATASDNAVAAALLRLRADISARQAQAGSALVPLVQNGQAELANRLNEIAVKVDRIDRATAARRPAPAEPVRPSRGG